MKRFNLLKSRERFLIIEITSSGVNGLFLSVDDERNIIFEKRVKNINLKKFFASPVRTITQKSWEGNYFFKSRRKVIAVADSSIATTIPIPLSLERDRGLNKEEVLLPELENLIAQAMGKIFNQCRSEAAKRLGIHEIDTLLVGAKARHFKVDGHQVVNPVGFGGKKISLLLELTFTTRIVFDDLKQFFNSPEDFFFAESSQIRLSSLSHTRKLPLNLIVAEHSGTSLFVLQKAKDDYPVLYRERLVWKFDTLFHHIAQSLGVSELTARELYRHYQKGDVMSEAASRAFKKIIDPAVEALIKEIGKGKVKGFVYVDAEYDLPFTLPYRRNGATFDRLPLAEIMGELGFANIEEATFTPAVLSRYLLPFFEAYFDKSNSDINKKLRRRLHWLTE